MSAEKPSAEMFNRYAQHKLSEAEEAQVELWLMDHPQDLEQAILDEHLSSGLQKTMFTNRPKLGSWFHWVAYPVVLATAAFGFFGSPHFNNAPTSTELQIVRLSTVRSGSVDDAIKISPGSAVALEIPVPMHSSGPYQIQITGEGGHEFHLTIVKAPATSTLTILLTEDALTIGRNQIVVRDKNIKIGAWRALFGPPDG